MEPEEITGLTNEALAEAIAKFQADLDAALANENPTREDAQAAREMHETLSALEAEKAARDKDTADFAAMREQRAAAQDPEPEAPAVEAATEDPAPEPDPAPAEPQAVTASARQSMAGRRPERDPDPEDEAPRITITASADVPGFATGSSLATLKDVGIAMVNRMKAFPQGPGSRDGQMQRYGVASFRKPIPEDRVTNGGEDADFLAIENAARESRLEGGSLVAAGGWCAPSETLYDLCAIETTDGLLDLPEFEVRRGGVRHTTGADFSDLYDGSFRQTEAEAIAGTTKECLEIDCPEFTDVRLEAVGLCIRVPLLTQAGYPELVANTMERALIAYQHKQSADMIGRISTAIGTAEVVPSQGSTASNTLTALELVADQKRQDYALSQSQSMEVLLPFWVKGAIRADLSLRNGVDFLAVNDAQIAAHFAARNLRVQWLYNWQQNTEDGIYPATFDAMMYPAGAFTKGTANVLSLDAVYDAASLAVNMKTGLFFEEGVLLLQRCLPSAKVTITVCSGGRTGAADNIVCLTAGDIG